MQDDQRNPDEMHFEKEDGSIDLKTAGVGIFYLLFGRRRRSRLGIIIALTLVTIIGVWGWCMMGRIMGGDADRRLAELNGGARSVARAAEQWRTDGKELEAFSGQVYKDGGEFRAYLQKYENVQPDHYYAVVTDGKGGYLYTLYSYKPIDERYLKTPPAEETQLALLKSIMPSDRAKAVGVSYS